MTNTVQFESYSGNLIEGLLDAVDRLLLPHLTCDGMDFYLSEPFPCQNKSVREVGGQSFCEKHAKAAESLCPDCGAELRVREGRFPDCEDCGFELLSPESIALRDETKREFERERRAR